MLVSRTLYIPLSVALTDRYQPPTVPATPPIVYVELSYCNGEPSVPAATPDTLGP